MQFTTDEQDFDGSWNEFVAADAPKADSGNAIKNDITDWDKPQPVDESWGDPLGLKDAREAVVAKNADDSTADSVARKYLEDYMTGRDKKQQAATEPVASPQPEVSQLDDVLLGKDSKTAKPKDDAPAPTDAIFPIVAMAASAFGGKKSAPPPPPPDPLSLLTASSQPASKANDVDGASKAGDVPLPTLSASWVDELFKKEIAARNEYLQPEDAIQSLSEVKADGKDRSSWKWDLGGNDAGSFIKRGAAAVGVAPPVDAYQPGTMYAGDEGDRATPSAYEQQLERNPTASEIDIQSVLHGNLLNAAQQSGFDLSQYQMDVPAKTVSVWTGDDETGSYQDVVRPASKAVDVQRLYADLDERLKDLYLVGGMAQGLPGQSGNTGQKAVQSLYMRQGEELVPVGQSKVYDAPENSHGFFGDFADLAKDMAVEAGPVLAMMAAPFTGGLSTGLASSIGTATGMGATASTMAANALIGAGTAAVTGGDPIKAALTAGLASGVSQINPGAMLLPEAGKLAQSGINNFLGTTIATGNPLAGLKTAGLGMAVDSVSPSIAKAVGDATGIDPKNASAITGWAFKNAPALLSGGNLTPGQVAGLISASIPKRTKT